MFKNELATFHNPHPMSRYAPQTYDAVWAIALASKYRAVIRSGSRLIYFYGLPIEMLLDIMIYCTIFNIILFQCGEQKSIGVIVPSVPSWTDSTIRGMT